VTAQQLYQRCDGEARHDNAADGATDSAVASLASSSLSSCSSDIVISSRDAAVSASVGAYVAFSAFHLPSVFHPNTPPPPHTSPLPLFPTHRNFPPSATRGRYLPELILFLFVRVMVGF
jgi:hypothetical protein